MATILIPPRTAHLWCASPPEITDPGLLSLYESLMTPEERDIEARFHFAKHRHTHRITRALARTVLSGYLGVAPASLRFEPGPWGRPEITGPVKTSLSWNLAHTDGLVVLLVADGCTVGVDVEDAVHRRAPLDVAEHQFAASEVAELRSLPPERQPRRFFDYWTLKESYIKARGMGLAIPLSDFAFDPRGPGAPTISFHGIDDDPEDWQFALLQPTDAHLVAVALQRGRGPDWTIEVRRTVPLCGASP